MPNRGRFIRLFLLSHSGGGAVAPVFTVAPAITGTAVVGQTLTCDGGTVTGTEPITRSYQWYRGVTPIGTDSATYTLVQADAGQNIKCTGTATNIAGSANADSNTLAIMPQWGVASNDVWGSVSSYNWG